MKLADYLSKHEITQKALAELLGVSQGRVWQWLDEDSVPPKYCPDIEVWSNREVTCEELNSTVNWHYVRDSARSIADSETPPNAVDRGAASDDMQVTGGSVDSEPKRKGGGSRSKTKEQRLPART